MGVEGGGPSSFKPVNIKILRALYQEDPDEFVTDPQAIALVRKAYSGNVEDQVCRDFSIMLVHEAKQSPAPQPFYCLPQHQREQLVKTAGKIKEDPFSFNDYFTLLQSAAHSYDPLYMGKNTPFKQAKRITYTKR